MDQKSSISIHQARFHELRRRKEAIQASVAPIRAERDRIVNAHREIELKLDAELAVLEKDLPEIASELGFLARGLGGNTGVDPQG